MRQVILIPDMESGGYVVEVPSLPGCYSQGETVEEAIANVREAINLHIESMTAHGEEVPEDIAPIQLSDGMSKLTPVSARECIRALQRIGFVIDRQFGKPHHVDSQQNPPGRITVPNHKELKVGMLRRIIRDAELTVDEFP